jgi:hypothetical protein
MTSVRRIAAVAAFLASCLLAATVAQAGPPRLERKQLRPADMALAKRVTLRASDLVPGWARRPATKFPDELPSCPGADLDFSAFTITGRAQSKFTRGPATIESLVEVFASRRDAVGDFRKGSNPELLRCVRTELQKQGIRVESVKMTGRPAVGERGFAFRVVMLAAFTEVYMDVVGFQRGRTIVGLYFTGAKPVAGRLAIARALAARAR